MGDVKNSMSVRPRDEAVRARLLASILASCLLAAGPPGCDWSGSSGGRGVSSASDPVPGDMSDRSYFKVRGKPPRTSASGKDVRMEDFDGRFVWTEYAAPWCSACASQAPIVRGLERSLGDQVTFVTVMTSENGGYGHPATRETASRWAGQHGLDPDRVVAADLTAVAVPRHILFSPEGHMLFLKTGSMRGDEIREVIAGRTEDWRRWSRSGERSSWMR